MTDDSFWRDLGDAKQLPTPAGLLKDQATRLNQIAGRSLRARVLTSTPSAKYYRFRSTLNVEVPALSQYRLDIVTTWYPLAPFYPVTLHDDLAESEEKSETICNYEGEFSEELRRVLGSERTTATLRHLIALASSG